MSVSHDIYREQVMHLARQTPSNTAITGGIGLFTSVILWNSAPDLWLLAWMMAHLIITSIAYVRWRKSLSKKRWIRPAGSEGRDKRRKHFLPLAVGWSVCSGAIWGSVTFFLPELSPTGQLAVIIVMVSMASGASSTLAAVPYAAAGFILADLVPAIIYFFLQGTLVYSLLGIMAIIYTLAMLYSTRIVYGNFLEAAQNRRENAKLLEQIHDERKSAEDNLLQSEQRYRDVVETIGDMIANTDTEGNFLFTNRALRDTLGYDADEIAALKFLDIIDVDSKATVLRATRTAYTSRLSGTAEFILSTKIGLPVWVEATVTPMFENGRYLGINGVLRDIGLRKKTEQTQHELQAQLQQRVAEATFDLASINTSLQEEVSERRQAERAWRNSEAQLRLILDSIVEAIYGVDLEGRCTFANMACAVLLGYEEAAELLGADMHTLAHARSSGVPAQNCPICNVHRINAQNQSDDKYFSRQNGSQFPVEYTAGSIMRDGRLVGGVVAFLDISRRRMAEDQLRQSQKMEAVGQLTGGIAHDFNNLLAIIVGNLDLLTASAMSDIPLLNAAVLRRTDAVMRAAERAGALTRRLLTFSRQKLPGPLIINPGMLVDDMSEILRRTLGDEISFDIHMAYPLWGVRIDPSLFENALLNLSINARDAMAGAGTLSIDLRNAHLDAPLRLARLQAPEGDYVKLTVRDTGRGISPEIIDRVFEPFFTTKDLGQGTGLGLSMVSGFVTQSGGYIQLDSEPGHGALVTIYLPRASAVEADNSIPSQSGFPAPVNIAPNDVSILVVEDDHDLRHISVSQLSDLGYKVLCAEDGPSALDTFRANPSIQLVYTDIMMPNGMSGPELVAHIRALKPGIKALFCSGFHGDVDGPDASHTATILQKPVRKALLAQTLIEVLSA
ncbi:MAG: PAS domain S-box protein [Alphaproteobacteria bacterium]